MERIKINRESDEWPNEIIREDLKDLGTYMAERIASIISLKHDSCSGKKSKRKKQN